MVCRCIRYRYILASFIHRPVIQVSIYFDSCFDLFDEFSCGSAPEPRVVTFFFEYVSERERRFWYHHNILCIWSAPCLCCTLSCKFQCHINHLQIVRMGVALPTPPIYQECVPHYQELQTNNLRPYKLPTRVLHQPTF